MSAPKFAMIDEGAFRKLPSLEQRILCDDAFRAFPDIRPHTTGNPSERWQVIRQGKELFWQAVRRGEFARARGNSGKQTKADADLFASFPPFPPAGEVCGCPACKEARNG